MIVIKAGNRIIINPTEIYIRFSGNSQYSIKATTSDAYGDSWNVWPLDREVTSREECEEMLAAISEAIVSHFKSPLLNVHVDIELVERGLKEKKEEYST